MSLNVPPRVTVSWTATALGVNFGGYRLYRRPARAPSLPWSLVGKLDVPTGYTPATVEAQHTAFVDYEPGWAFTSGEWTSGWDYAISSLNALTGVEGPKSTVVASVTVTPDTNYWAASNAAPYFNFPLTAVTTFASGDDQAGIWRGDAAGRDLTLVRVPIELPARQWDLHFKDFARLGEDAVRTWRAACAAGVSMCVHTVRGDRLIGALLPLQRGAHTSDGAPEWDGSIVETLRDPNYVAAQYNLPAGYVLNGTTQALSVADNALLNPAGAFTVCYAGILASSAAVKALVCKGDANGATTSGYGILKDASDRATFKFKGATTSGSIAGVAAGLIGDGKIHSVIATSTGTAQTLYVDGVQVGTAAVTHGAITVAQALGIGVDNTSALWAPLAPVNCAGFYNRALSASEVAATDGDLRMFPNYRMPGASAFFLDLRDARCWNGLSAPSDVSGNGLVVSLVAAPTPRGIPWPLAAIDKF